MNPLTALPMMSTIRFGWLVSYTRGDPRSFWATGMSSVKVYRRVTTVPFTLPLSTTDPFAKVLTLRHGDIARELLRQDTWMPAVVGPANVEIPANYEYLCATSKLKAELLQ